ncbi:MAG: PrpF protein [Betaproteobacteria bacterium]|nr:PrpF protein [Betaproteobacteria bacterium]
MSSLAPLPSAASFGRLPAPELEDFVPRATGGIAQFPVYYMRGGTSTGIVLWHEHVPEEQALKEELIRAIMGVPACGESRGNKQTTGLGRGAPTSNKVFIVSRPNTSEADIASTLAQLAADKSAIDWSVNCGNMSAALPMYALETGLIEAAAGRTTVRIFNTNTGVTTDATVRTPDANPFIPPDTEIPGVMGKFPGVELTLRHPVGAKTGKLLPTCHPSDSICGIDVSCVDVAVPMVILRAADVGKTGLETPDELSRDGKLKERLREIWVAAGLKMGLRRRGGSLMTAADLAHSETVPKVCLISPGEGDVHISARYFTPQSPHSSLAVTGGCCLAVACLVPGTVANAVAQGLAPVSEMHGICTVAMRNPAGVLRARIGATVGTNGLRVTSVAYERSAQLLLRGHFPIYGASPELREFAARW